MPPMPLLLALTTTPAEPQLSYCERSMSWRAPEPAEPRAALPNLLAAVKRPPLEVCVGVPWWFRGGHGSLASVNRHIIRNTHLAWSGSGPRKRLDPGDRQE